MLSIIVSSYQQEYFTQFSENIKETIGDDFQYEIIQQWNPGVMGICEAYNKGAEKAKYENLLFIHEDVLFETKDWGSILIEYLKNDNIGCVGVAGNNYTPNVPFAWWDLHEVSFRNIVQYNEYKFVRKYILNNDMQSKSLDGVFIACRKKNFEKNIFNEKIKGFHMYDLEFSNKIASDLDNVVTSRILLKHFSEGSIDQKWFYNLVEYKKLIRSPKNQKINKRYEVYFFDKYYEYLKVSNFSNFRKFLEYIKYINPKFIGYKKSLESILISIKILTNE